ncbi:hypothetical protein [Nocardia sp. NPDC050435]|uniref:hypothetical protein n=1 Tax=Nocardia sp. NPDC050435 TaxID=3155040 RepID=UPI0033C9F479
MSIVPIWVWVGLLAGALAWVVVDRLGFGVTYWATRDPLRRSAIREAARIRRTWPRTAHALGLAHTVTTTDRRGRGPATTKVLIPPMVGIRVDQAGITMEFATVLGIGADDFSRQATHLANAWKVAEVVVRQSTPGRVQVRTPRPAQITTYSVKP